MQYEYLKAIANRLTYAFGMRVDTKSQSENECRKWNQDIPSLLNEFGKDGWELVHFERDCKHSGNDWEMFFKRPIHSCLNNCPNDDLFRQETLETANVTGVELLKRAHAMLSDSDAMWDLTYVTKMSNERFVEWRRLYQDIADHLQIVESKRAMVENCDNDIQEG